MLWGLNKPCCVLTLKWKKKRESNNNKQATANSDRVEIKCPNQTPSFQTRTREWSDSVIIRHALCSCYSKKAMKWEIRLSMKCRSVACIWSGTPFPHRVTAVAALTEPPTPTFYTAGSDGSIIWWTISSSPSTPVFSFFLFSFPIIK